MRTVGIEPFHLRLVAFVISGAITGLAGALFAYLQHRFRQTRLPDPHRFGELGDEELILERLADDLEHVGRQPREIGRRHLD